MSGHKKGCLCAQCDPPIEFDPQQLGPCQCPMCRDDRNYRARACPIPAPYEWDVKARAAEERHRETDEILADPVAMAALTVTAAVAAGRTFSPPDVRAWLSEMWGRTYAPGGMVGPPRRSGECT